MDRQLETNRSVPKKSASLSSKSKKKKSFDGSSFFSKQNLMSFLFLLIAGCINATGVGIFLAPSRILDGGISGTSILLAFLTPIPTSFFIFFINLPFFVLGFKRLGWSFIIRSLFAIAVYSIIMLFFEKRSSLSNELLLTAVFGGLLSGVGSGLVIRNGGCLDGIEVLAVLFSKKFSLTVGQMVMIYNALMMTVGAFIFDFDRALFSIIAYAVGIKAVDAVVEGLDKAKGVTIITQNGEKVAAKISAQYQRGITITQGRGYYSGKPSESLYVVVNRFEVPSMITMIKMEDPQAFVSVTDISEVASDRYNKRPQSRNSSTAKKEKK